MLVVVHSRRRASGPAAEPGCRNRQAGVQLVAGHWVTVRVAPLFCWGSEPNILFAAVSERLLPHALAASVAFFSQNSKLK